MAKVMANPVVPAAHEAVVAGIAAVHLAIAAAVAAPA